jgi:hypothetical protein
MADKVGGVKQFKPKKNISKTVGRKISKIFKPSRLLGIGGLALAAPDIIDTGSFAYKHRKELGNALSTLKGWDNLISGTGEAMVEGIKPPEFFKPYAKATKKRMSKNKKPLFKRNKKDILKSIGRKKGGKVGRPKGVGCAIRGHGKAMKRGK